MNSLEEDHQVAVTIRVFWKSVTCLGPVLMNFLCKIRHKTCKLTSMTNSLVGDHQAAVVEVDRGPKGGKSFLTLTSALEFVQTIILLNIVQKYKWFGNPALTTFSFDIFRVRELSAANMGEIREEKKTSDLRYVI